MCCCLEFRRVNGSFCWLCLRLKHKGTIHHGFLRVFKGWTVEGFREFSMHSWIMFVNRSLLSTAGDARLWDFQNIQVWAKIGKPKFGGLPSDSQGLACWPWYLNTCTFRIHYPMMIPWWSHDDPIKGVFPWYFWWLKPLVNSHIAMESHRKFWCNNQPWAILNSKPLVYQRVPSGNLT